MLYPAGVLLLQHLSVAASLCHILLQQSLFLHLDLQHRHQSDQHGRHFLNVHSLGFEFDKLQQVAHNGRLIHHADGIEVIQLLRFSGEGLIILAVRF